MCQTLTRAHQPSEFVLVISSWTKFFHTAVKQYCQFVPQIYEIRKRPVRDYRCAKTSCPGLQMCQNFKTACHQGSRTASVNISHLPPYPSHTHIRFAFHAITKNGPNKLQNAYNTPAYTTAGGET